MQLTKHLRSQYNVLNLPNCLTLFRIWLLPVMAMLLAYDGNQPPFESDWMFRYSPGRLAAVVVAIAGITDWLDGYFARRWHIESLLGKFLDPVADKLFLLVGLVMLQDLGRVPAWMVILLLSREFLVTGLRGVAAGEGLIIGAGDAGKWKLTFQLIGLGFLMWYGNSFGFPAHKIGIWILNLALFISLFSGYNYLSDFLTAMKKKNLASASA